MARDTILVTGVTGFVGAAVARVFAETGYQVRGMARASSDRTNLVDFPGEIVPGDLGDVLSLKEAMRGVDGLAHVAADYRLWAPNESEIILNNHDGTANVMDAALRAGLKRVVYTSSVATLAPAHDPNRPSHEDRPLTSRTAIGAYKRSKVIAERLVEEMVAHERLPAVIVNPSTPIGPRDVKPTPTGRMIVDAATGKMPAYVETGLNFVHVDDCARGHLLAYEKGTVGRRYILGGQDVTLGDFFKEIARAAGRKPPSTKLPIAPLYPIAWASEAWARISGKAPMLTVDTLRMSSHYMYYSSRRAETELGYSARPWQEAVADALTWFRAHGKLE